MCGLCGVAGNIGKQDILLFRWLLFLAQLRGEDSTGVLRIARGSNKQLKKDPSYHFPYNKMRQIVPTSQFLATDDEKHTKKRFLWDPNDSIAFFGHARFATKGSKDDVTNAHPFEFSDVVGMQNGTIHKKFKHSTEYKTDTEALYRNINDYGIEAALNEAEAFDSAWALTYWNKKDHTLNFIRNDKRPLWMALCDNKSVLAWASEDWMLRKVVDRLFNNEKIDIFQPNPDMLFSYNLTGPEFWKHPETKKLEIKKTFYQSSTTYHKTKPTSTMEYWGSEGDDWGEGLPAYDHSREELLAGTNLPRQPLPVPVINTGKMLVQTQKESSKSSFRRYFFKVLGGLDIPRTAFAKLMDRGCSFCGDPGDIDDPLVDTKIGWLDKEDWVCEKCQNHDWVSGSITYTKIHFSDSELVDLKDRSSLKPPGPQVG